MTQGGTGCPSFYSWLGAQGEARAATRALAKTLILNRANGARHYFYDYVWDENGVNRLYDAFYTDNRSLLDFDGSGKPTLGALAASARLLEGAERAGRVETRDLKAYVFQKGSDTLVAAWSPTALTQAREISVGDDPRRLRVFNLMGNPSGFRNREKHLSINLRNEPTYILVRETAPAVVLQALKTTGPRP